MQEEAGGLGPTQGDLSAHHPANLLFYSPGCPLPPSLGRTLLEPGKALGNENPEGSSQEPGLWSERTDFMQEPRPDQDKAISSFLGLPRAMRTRLSISVNYHKMPK